MDTMQAIQYRYDLNKYIKDCLKSGYWYDAIWEGLSTNPDFEEFITTRIGFIWKTKMYGKEFVKWATS